LEASEPFGSVPQASEKPKSAFESFGNDEDRIREMEGEITDLKIANRGKDMFIEHLQKEREGILGKLLESSRKKRRIGNSSSTIGGAKRW